MEEASIIHAWQMHHTINKVLICQKEQRKKAFK